MLNLPLMHIYKYLTFLSELYRTGNWCSP